MANKIMYLLLKHNLPEDILPTLIQEFTDKYSAETELARLYALKDGNRYFIESYLPPQKSKN